jgi:tricarballylate dehydrogenase
MTEIKADVIVVGMGIAGLCAALTANEAGAKVVVVDRAPRGMSGGNTRYTEAFMRMKSVDEPSDDLADALLGDFMGWPDPSLLKETLEDRASWSTPTRTLNIVDFNYVETLLAGAGPTLRWLTSHGVRFEALPTPFLTTSTTRLSPVGGGLALVEALTAALESTSIEVLYETTARSLILDGDEVVGLHAVGTSGAVTLRGQVLLASGGYEGNSEMLSRFHGPLAMLCRPVAVGGHYNKGEGIEMALAVGADTAGNFSLFHAEPIDPRSGVAEAAIFAFPYGVLVNEHGERFVDEAPGPVDAFYERITRQIQAQTKGVAYLILDATGQGVPNIRTALRTDQPPIIGQSLDELAQRLDVDPSTLTATIDAYNGACGPEDFDHSKPDGKATRGLVPPKSNWATPIADGPFHAYPIMAANVFTFGGLRTDENARVVSRDGRPIGGLFAAGEMTGLYYSNYTGSTSVLRGAVFGRIGGRCAAGVVS